MLLFKPFTRILILTTVLLLIGCQPQLIAPVSKKPEVPTILPSITDTPTILKVLIPTNTLTLTPPTQETNALSVSLVEKVPFDFGKPLPVDVNIDVYKMNRPVLAEEIGYEQVLNDLNTRSSWPGTPIAPQYDLQTNNDSLSSLGCLLKKDGKDDLYPYSLYCKGIRILSDFDLFSPVYVNQSKNDFIVTVSQKQNGVISIKSHSKEPVMPDEWSGPYAQFLGDNEIKSVTEQDKNNKIFIDIYLDGKIIDKIQANNYFSTKALMGLWTYNNHWAVEVFDNVIIDGQSINSLYGYKRSFEFHLIGLKPLFFFEKDGKIGLNFNGQEIELNGYILPHGNCCSAALLDPRQNGNVLIFFLNKDSQWYYFEVKFIPDKL